MSQFTENIEHHKVIDLRSLALAIAGDCRVPPGWTGYADLQGRWWDAFKGITSARQEEQAANYEAARAHADDTVGNRDMDLFSSTDLDNHDRWNAANDAKYTSLEEPSIAQFGALICDLLEDAGVQVCYAAKVLVWDRSKGHYEQFNDCAECIVAHESLEEVKRFAAIYAGLLRPTESIVDGHAPKIIIYATSPADCKYQQSYLRTRKLVA